MAAVATAASRGSSSAGPAGAETTAALRVQLAGAPQGVRGSDGREHLEYDVVATNAFPGPATLRSVVVRGAGRRLLALRGPALGEATAPLASTPPGELVIAPAASTVTQVDLVLPRPAGRRSPRRLVTAVHYALPASAPARPVIGTTTVRVPAWVDRRAPVVIAAPLRGGGWVNANGCCADATAPHRSTIVPTSRGRFTTPETFAVDWTRVAGGLLFGGDGSANADWPTFGAPLHAVAAGVVARARDGTPDIPPFTHNPGLRTPRDFAGNSVILRIGPGRYACYAHLQRGSVRVHRGDRVRVGERVGLVGNSGNTDGPHLHFGIQARPDCLSRSLPFEIDRYRLQGLAGPDSRSPRIDVVGRAHSERRSHPLVRSIIRMGPPARNRDERAPPTPRRRAAVRGGVGAPLDRLGRAAPALAAVPGCRRGPVREAARARHVGQALGPEDLAGPEPAARHRASTPDRVGGVQLRRAGVSDRRGARGGARPLPGPAPPPVRHRGLRPARVGREHARPLQCPRVQSGPAHVSRYPCWV